MNPIIEKIKQYAVEMGIEIYMVGGAVRDTILGREVSDNDFIVSVDCHKAAVDIADRFNGSYVNMHRDVARVVAGDTVLDFSNFKGIDIYEDLMRRDFTINSIAINIKDNSIIDINHGMEDINRKTIRMVYKKAFDEDPLRIIRGVRLAARLGFEIEIETESLMVEKTELIKNVPGERILDELYKIFGLENSHKHIARLDELGVLEVVLPVIKLMKRLGKCRYHLVDAYTHSLLTLTHLEKDIDNLFDTKWGDKLKEHLYVDVNGLPRLYTLKFAAFLHDIGKPDAYREENGEISFRGHDKTGLTRFSEVSERLVMSSRQKEIIKAIISGHMRILGLFDKEVSSRALYRLFRDFDDNIIDVLICSLYDVTATRSLLDEKRDLESYREYILELIDRYYEYMEKDKKLVTGRDVIEILGYSGGKIGEVLKQVDEEIFNGNIKTRDEALEYIKGIGSIEK